MNKILFICKNRENDYDSTYSNTFCKDKSSGLLNSVKFLIDILTQNSVECKVVDVVDNNCIDKEVSLYKPTHVIIEALWVVPSKFEVLCKLHPDVKWIVRLHSELPFIAGEGIAMDWIFNYVKYPNVSLGANSKRMVKSLEFLTKTKVLPLPNYYEVRKPLKDSVFYKISDSKYLDVGCFGAIRPLKNQLIQAVAAMRYATENNMKLRFHINCGRVEGNGQNNLKNIIALFDNNIHGHSLVQHQWMSHDNFLLLLSLMDMSMQVSYTETYNIVAADSISMGVPVVTSSEVNFVSSLFQADFNSVEDIVDKMNTAYRWKLNWINVMLLRYNAVMAKRQWLKLFK